MPRRLSIELPEELAKIVDALVASGGYRHFVVVVIPARRSGSL